MDPASSAAATLLLFGVLGPVPATAQTIPGTGAMQTSVSTTTTLPSAYAQLSAANQKVARALYNAQAKTAATRPMTLNQIAGMKQRGQSWNQVFTAMKAQGLVHEQSLAQLVSNANRPSSQTSASTAVSPSTKAHPKSRPAHALRAEDDPSASVGSTEPGRNY